MSNIPYPGRASDTVITALNVTISVFLLATVILPSAQDRREAADNWCKDNFEENYKGLGTVKAFVDGGAHCVLENNTWVGVPEKIFEEVDN